MIVTPVVGLRQAHGPPRPPRSELGVDHAREACDLRRLPGTVARPPRTRSSSALPVGMRACARAAVQPSQQGEVRRIGPRCLRARSPRRRLPSASPRPHRPVPARPTGSRAVSRPMHGDRHPWQPPCRHGWHVAPGPRQGRRRLGEVVAVFRRRARNAPDQVTSAGLCMGMTWPVSSQRRMASQRLCIIGHRRPSRRSARVTHHTTDASSVRGPRPWGPPQAFPRHGGRGRIGRVRSHVHHHAHQRRVMEPADRTGQSESSDWHRRVCASSWRRSEATPHEP